ncbi:hypothetical protein ACPEEZ_05475 [Frigoribacterium sp. 2-23]|uniref:hypothetical protein n=1 Tax=Frigoribacterium sp. 2-23 TaxID=3415006 RepID=UPI003C705A85
MTATLVASCALGVAECDDSGGVGPGFAAGFGVVLAVLAVGLVAAIVIAVLRRR